jgi:hypothetical protein
LSKHVDQYEPKIRTGLPPPREKTRYDTKMVEGALRLMAEQVRHGQYVEMSAGSAGKFRKIVQSRGLETVQRRRQGESVAVVYVVDPKWLSAHPEV